jgi:hypothetical protein
MVIAFGSNPLTPTLSPLGRGEGVRVGKFKCAEANLPAEKSVERINVLLVLLPKHNITPPPGNRTNMLRLWAESRLQVARTHRKMATPAC